MSQECQCCFCVNHSGSKRCAVQLRVSPTTSSHTGSIRKLPHRSSSAINPANTEPPAHRSIFATVMASQAEIKSVRDGKEEEKLLADFYNEDPVYAAARGPAILADWCPKLKDYYSFFPDLRLRKGDWF